MIFLTGGEANTRQCQENLEKIRALCKWPGIPLKVQKIEGPAIILTFLGIELDTSRLEMHLPREKFERLKEELKEWEGRTFCQKRTLLSLIGKLSHACKVVTAG